jgi:hypothetical protein
VPVLADISDAAQAKGVSRTRLNEGLSRPQPKEAGLSHPRLNKANGTGLRLNGSLRCTSLMSCTRPNDSSISRPRLIMKQGKVPAIKGFESEEGHDLVKSFEEICRREQGAWELKSHTS